MNLNDVAGFFRTFTGIFSPVFSGLLLAFIPYHEVEALARVLLPEIQAFFESEDGQREYAEWKAKKQAKQQSGI